MSAILIFLLIMRNIITCLKGNYLIIIVFARIIEVLH